MIGDEFADIIREQFGVASSGYPPLNVAFTRPDGTAIMQIVINELGYLDVIGAPEDFTEAAEMFIEFLISAWDERMSGGSDVSTDSA